MARAKKPKPTAPKAAAKKSSKKAKPDLPLTTQEPKPRADGRRPDGTWAPGVSGNPAGMPPGIRNKSTLFYENLLDGEGEDIIRALICKAKSGNVLALQTTLPLLIPARRSRSRPAIEIGSVSSVADAVRAQGQIVALHASGELADDAAEALTRSLSQYVSLSKALALEEQVRLMAEKIEKFEQLLARGGAVSAGPASDPFQDIQQGERQ